MSRPTDQQKDAEATQTVTYRGVGDAVPRPDDPGFERGALLGRYVILDRIGGGGMGVVYAAYDPELDRKLAIKLLRSDVFSSVSAEEGRLRLRREAQALARLAHPNVVSVFDVGTFGEQVFVVMEFVEGIDLRHWRLAGSRTWREVLEVYLQAGRGLAAAHEAGLVHRDFKPSNVILGEDGRVRVLDFGLARPAGEAMEESVGEIVSSPGHVSATYPLTSDLTEPGVQLGTPSYMAPEQRQHIRADARSDQFGFCTALYEALYGELPFEVDENADDFTGRVRRGEVREPPADAPTPSWLRKVLLRGLKARPEERYPSMGELLDALGRDPAAARRRWLQAGALAVLAGLALWGLLARQESRDLLCQGAERKLEGIWDAERKAAISQAFAATNLDYAETGWTSASKYLDDYTERWTWMHTEACKATHVHGEQSEDLLDLRMACLDDRLREVDALAGLLTQADAKVVERVREMTSGITLLERCNDPQALLAVTPLPEDEAQRSMIKELRGRLFAASFWRDAVQYEKAEGFATSALAEARQLDYPPLVAEAAFELADLRFRVGRFSEAIELLFQSLAAAEQGRHDEQRLEGLLSLVLVVGIRQGAHAEGERWLGFADGVLERLGRPLHWTNEWNQIAASLHIATGDLDDALDQAEAAVAGGRLVEPLDQHELAGYLSTLGHVQLRQGDMDEALESLEEMFEIRRRELGPGHPLTGAAHQGLGTVLGSLGHYTQALEHLEAARYICEPTFGRNSREMAIIHYTLGEVLFRLERFGRSLEHHEEALQIRRSLYGPDHVEIASSLNALGLTYLEFERFEEAEFFLEASLAMLHRTLGEDHPQLFNNLLNLGRLRRKQGRLDEAPSYYESAWKVAKKNHGEEDVRVAQALVGLGKSHLDARRIQEAIEYLQQGLQVLESRGETIRSEMIPDAYFHLAKAHDLLPSGRDKALAFARRAEAAYAELETNIEKDDRAALKDWLSERGAL